jgi:hypothetical protein
MRNDPEKFNGAPVDPHFTDAAGSPELSPSYNEKPCPICASYRCNYEETGECDSDFEDEDKDDW